MAERIWKKKRKGRGVVYVAEGIDCAIVDNKGLGFNPGIFWNGQKFSSVEAAQRIAEATRPLQGTPAMDEPLTTALELEAADLRDERMFWFLNVLAASGGSAPASDWPGEWVSAFCDDREPTDTLNLAEEHGFTRSAHDTSNDTSTVYLTDLGRRALAAMQSRRPAAASSPLVADLKGTPHRIERIWRDCDLPEWFLGNSGSNHKLYEFARRCAALPSAGGA